MSTSTHCHQIQHNSRFRGGVSRIVAFMRQSGAVGDGRVLLAVDGNSLVHRSFHAQAATGSRSPDGRPIWAVRGLVAQLVAAVERIGPDAIVVGFDDPDASVRKQQWPQYKATRIDKLETLVGQLTLAIEILRGMGIAVVVPPGLEADDVLASAAQFAPTVGARTVIMTSDRDSFSLIDQHTRVLRIINGGVEASPLLNEERLVMMLGVRADQYRDYAAMRGDASDNLPGVLGIGPKTAAKLLATLGTARAAFDDVAAGGQRVSDAIGAGAARRLAHPGARAAWERNCQVMAMHADLPLGLDLAGGPGSLPLDAVSIRRCFAPYQPGWAIIDALRVLTASDPAPRVTETVSREYGWSSPPPKRFPRLTLPVAARVDQLSLFD